MAIVWKINGVDVATLGLTNLRRTLENQRPDLLTFEDPAALVDDAPAYAIGDAIVLTRTVDSDPAVTWFRGVIRQTPRSADPEGEAIGYVAEGPWQWLERIAFLQYFSTPTTPSSTASSLETYLRGRTILGQNDDGEKVNLGTFLNAVLDHAIAASTAYVGSAVMQRADFSAVTALQVTAPWDEVVDLSCAEVVQRSLQLLPDAVCWWDYTTNPPTLNIDRRSNLSALTEQILPAQFIAACVVAAPGNVNLAANAPASIDGRALAAGDRVLLPAQTTAAQNGVYTFTNTSTPLARATEADTAAELNAAAVRVKAGTSAGKIFFQTATIATLGTDAVTWTEPSSRIFSIPVIRERPDLQKSGVVLIYVKTNRANEAVWETREVDDYPDGFSASSPDGLVRTIQLAGSVASSTVLKQKVEVDPLQSYLTQFSLVTSGPTFDSLHDWWRSHAPELRAPGVSIIGFRGGSRTQVDGTSITAACVNELVKGAITDWMEDEQSIVTEQQLIQIEVLYEIEDRDDNTKKERITKQLAVVVTATNAVTKTYSFTVGSSYTAPEDTPVGLAQAIYDSISPLHYDGRVVLEEAEASTSTLVGRVLNLTGGLPAWAAMDALVQRAVTDIDQGRTELIFGPPRQLGPDDLIELYRVNRNRQPVTSYLTRTTGKSGSTQSRQGLALWHPVKPGGTGSVRPARVYEATVTVAGTIPTSAEFGTAIQSVYTGSIRPTAGDMVSLKVGSAVKFRALVTRTDPGTGGGIFATSFTVSSITYYATITQVGIY